MHLAPLEQETLAASAKQRPASLPVAVTGGIGCAAIVAALLFTKRVSDASSLQSAPAR